MERDEFADRELVTLVVNGQWCSAEMLWNAMAADVDCDDSWPCDYSWLSNQVIC